MQSLKQGIKNIVKLPIVFGVNILARIRGFEFLEHTPTPWYWKLNILLNRYEKETLDVFRSHITKGMIVFDIGASLGYFTRDFSKLVGDTGMVYAFEPDPDSFARVVHNTQAMKNVRVFNIAISDKVGTADFFHIPNRTGLDSLMQYADAEHATAERKSVETISLDEFVKRENIPHVDAMKIDVEGAEPLVFAGMKQVLLQKPFVVFEYSAKYSHALVADLLKSHQLFSIPRTGKLTPIVGEPDEDCNNIVIADA